MKKWLILIPLFILIAWGVMQNQVIPKPPQPRLTVNAQEIPVILGTYGWKTPFKGVQADSPDPYELARNLRPAVVKPGDKVHISFRKNPQSFVVRNWHKSSQTQPGKVTAIPVEYLNKSPYFVLPQEKGEYVYEIFARWKEGQASFALSIQID